MSDDAPTPAGDAGRDPWPAPASDEDGGPQDAAAKVPLDKGAAPNPWAAPGGPGSTLASNEPLSPAPASVHDQMTVTSLPGVAPDAAPAPPWAGPAAPQAHGALGSFPPPDPATAAGGPPPNPFAPPVQEGAVPPPPLSPDGPGQAPYGYPGGYGYPQQPPGYFGWPGPGAAESNGMGVTALVLGIISAAVFCVWPVAIVLGILAVVFGAIGRGKASRGEATNPGQALAGIICGTAGIVLGIGLGALVIWVP